MKVLPINQIICKNCFEIVKDMPNESIDLVIADPPYENKFNLENFIQFVLPKIKKSGSLILFIFPDDIWKIKTPAKQICVWKEVYSPQGRITKKYRRFFDLILWYPKSENYAFNNLTRYQIRGVFDDSEWFKKLHPHQKPLSLIEKLVFIHSNQNDLVLDPFLGSGTTALACKILKRNYIGIEKEEEYCKIAKERLRNF